MENTFEILGIHDRLTRGLANDVARVRMFVGNEMVDEDFTLPSIPDGVSPTEAVYKWFLTQDVETRMNEISQGVINASDSQVDLVEKQQVEQIVEEVQNV